MSFKSRVVQFAIAGLSATTALSAGAQQQPSSSQFLLNEFQKCGALQDQREKQSCIRNAEQMARALSNAQQADDRVRSGQTTYGPGGILIGGGRGTRDGGAFALDREQAKLCQDALKNVQQTDRRISQLNREMTNSGTRAARGHDIERIVGVGTLAFSFQQQLRAAYEGRSFFNDQANLYCNTTRGGNGDGSVRGPQIPDSGGTQVEGVHTRPLIPVEPR